MPVHTFHMCRRGVGSNVNSEYFTHVSNSTFKHNGKLAPAQLRPEGRIPTLIDDVTGGRSRMAPKAALRHNLKLCYYNTD